MPETASRPGTYWSELVYKRVVLIWNQLHVSADSQKKLSPNVDALLSFVFRSVRSLSV
jgi:hypothetical protein